MSIDAAEVKQPLSLEENCERFSRVIHGNQPESDICVTNYALPKEIFIPAGDSQRLVQEVRYWQNKNNKKSIVISLNLFAEHSRTEEKCAVVNGIFIDIDTLEGKHSAAKEFQYPKTNEEGLELLLQTTDSPTVLVNSGGGLHALYLFDKPFQVQTEADRAYIKQVISNFVKSIVSTFNSKKYHLDCTDSLTHTIRIPGTINRKQGKIVSLLKDDGKRFSIPEIEGMTKRILETLPAEDFDNGSSSKDAEKDYSEYFGTIDPLELCKKCAALGDQYENPEQQSNEEWVNIGINIFSFPEIIEGDKFIHEYSSGYRGYTFKQTQARIDYRRKKDYKPISCSKIAEITGNKFCKDCTYRGTVKNPLQIVMPKRTPAGNLYDDYWERIEAARRNLDGTRYYSLDKGLFQYAKLDKVGALDGYITLANFVAKIDKQIIEDNGADVVRMIELSGLLSPGIPLPAIRVPSNHFESMNWVISEWGTRLNIRPETNAKNKLRSAIQELSTDQQEEYIFTHMGWRKINGNWTYLHNGGAVNGEQIKVNLKNDGLDKYNLPESPGENLKDSIRASLNLLNVATDEITYSLLAMIGLAPLCEPLRKAGIEPSFVLWLLGVSGARKSSVTALFLSHFGEFNAKTLPAGFKDTPNAIEKKAFLTKDSILVVDDYHPKATLTESKRIEDIAQQLLRGYGDHQGRARMKPDGTLRKAYIPQGLCIVTGEDVPSAGTSTTSRYFAVEFTSESVNLDELTKAQEEQNAVKLGQSMRGYLEWLSGKLDDIPAGLKELFVNVRNKVLQENSVQHGRIPETIAWLAIGLERFVQYAVHHEALTADEGKHIVKKGLSIFSNMGQRHSAQLQNDTPVKQFLNALRELRSTKKVRFEHKAETSEFSDIGELLGYFDNNYYYLFPETVMNIVTQFYLKQNRNFNISCHMLLKHMENENIIQTELENGQLQRTKRIQIKGSRKRLIWLNRQALDEYETQQTIDEDEDNFLS